MRRYKSKFAVCVRDEWEADRHAHLSMGEAETHLPGPDLYLRHAGEHYNHQEIHHALLEKVLLDVAVCD